MSIQEVIHKNEKVAYIIGVVMTRETGLLIGIVATGVGFGYGNILLMMAGAIIILMESKSDA